MGILDGYDVPMRRTILFGLITLSISFLLLLVPSTSAVQHKAIIDTAHELDDTFIDLAVLLTMLNTIIGRLLNDFPMNVKGMVYNIQVLLYLTHLLTLLKEEYNSGMSLPRYKAYQMYFMSLFSIFGVSMSKKLSNNSPIIATISNFILMVFAIYCGNVLYVTLGRPGE